MKRMSVYGGAMSVFGGVRRRRRVGARKRRVGRARLAPLRMTTVPVLAGARRRRRRVGGVRRRRLHGRGIFGDIWSGIKSVASKIPLSTVNDALKRTGLVSSGLSMLPGIGGVASGLARQAGYARRRRHRKTYHLALGSARPHRRHGARRHRRHRMLA